MPTFHIRIRTVSYGERDLEELAKSIREAGITDELDIDTDHGMHFWMDVAIAGGALLGKKAIDIIGDLVKQWLEKRPAAAGVTIYDEHGKPVYIENKKYKPWRP